MCPVGHVHSGGYAQADRRVCSGGYTQTGTLRQLCSAQVTDHATDGIKCDAGRFVTSTRAVCAETGRWWDSGGSSEALLHKVKMILLHKMLEPATSI